MFRASLRISARFSAQRTSRFLRASSFMTASRTRRGDFAARLSESVASQAPKSNYLPAKTRISCRIETCPQLARRDPGLAGVDRLGRGARLPSLRFGHLPLPAPLNENYLRASPGDFAFGTSFPRVATRPMPMKLCAPACRPPIAFAAMAISRIPNLPPQTNNAN